MTASVQDSGDQGRLLVVGAGTMGAQIAQQAALHGIHVSLVDVDSDHLQRAMAGNRQWLDRRVEKGRIERAEADAAASRVTATTDLASAAAEVGVGDRGRRGAAVGQARDLRRAGRASPGPSGDRDQLQQHRGVAARGCDGAPGALLQHALLSPRAGDGPVRGGAWTGNLRRDLRPCGCMVETDGPHADRRREGDRRLHRQPASWALRRAKPSRCFRAASRRRRTSTSRCAKASTGRWDHSSSRTSRASTRS